nr:MAG TPA: hypothetical protein [Caudoviricetes sp.]
MLCAVGVSDAILGACQLFFDIFTAFFRLLTPLFRLNDIGELNNKVEFSGTTLLINSVQNIQFPDQTLHSGVRFVHHCKERVFHNGHRILWQNNVLLLSSLFVIAAYFDMLWVPFQNFSGS